MCRSQRSTSLCERVLVTVGAEYGNPEQCAEISGGSDLWRRAPTSGHIFDKASTDSGSLLQNIFPVFGILPPNLLLKPSSLSIPCPLYDETT